MHKYRVGIIGATGYVGQRFVSLLDNHPWFEVTKLMASPRSAGRTYENAMRFRWVINAPMPEYAKMMPIENASNLDSWIKNVDFVFCAVDLPKEDIVALETAIAKAEIPVISNNSALRLVQDVPVIIPEANPEACQMIDIQRQRLGTKRGFVVCKPNCSVQSYVPPLGVLRAYGYGIEHINVTTFQAISGAGKTFATWPEITGNVIPYIAGEEAKSEIEPLKIWGKFINGAWLDESELTIDAHCIRVAVQEGHLAAVTATLDRPCSAQIFAELITTWHSPIYDLGLPSSPSNLFVLHQANDRPQSKLDAELGKGMSISLGRISNGNDHAANKLNTLRFICLSHNTIRGAAGGAILTAELLAAKGWLM